MGSRTPQGKTDVTKAFTRASPKPELDGMTVHYGTPNGAFLKKYCGLPDPPKGEPLEWITPRLGLVNCEACIAKIRNELD